MNKTKAINKDEQEYQINVLLKDKKFKIYCGEGNQKLRWLTDVVIHKYERYHGVNCGIYSIKKEWLME